MGRDGERVPRTEEGDEVSRRDYPLDYDQVDDTCLHVSYAEQAGGFLICDDCGKDVTLEILRSAEYQARSRAHQSNRAYATRKEVLEGS